MADTAVAAAQLPPTSLGLMSRLWLLSGCLTIECLLIAKLSRPWLSTHQIMAAPIAFCTALLLFAAPTLKAAGLDRDPVRKSFAWLHLFAVILCSGAIHILHTLPSTDGIAEHLAAAAWISSVLTLAVSLTAMLFPLQKLLHTLARLGTPWFYAVLCTVTAMAARPLAYTLWSSSGSGLGRAMQTYTFNGVRVLLRLFYPHVIARPGTFILGTTRFKVQVSGQCSGLEGMALVLIFCVAWIIFARKELRVERALMLVPLALAATWLLNLVRLAVLIALGHAGHADIAMTGFHSEAGWMAFNAIALLYLFAMHRLPWVHRAHEETGLVTGTDRTVAAAYLLPFLALLLAAMLGRLLSNGFDAAYPLRLLFVVPVLWRFRNKYRRMNWSFGWIGPLAGLGVFLLWAGFARWHPGDDNLLSTQLATLPLWQRDAWLSVRAFTAVLIVPLAEELAFRGYLARRVQSDEIEAISFSRISALGIIVSATAFGAMHGHMWVAGIIAGVVFAGVAKWRNRLGEAIAAHIVANLLLTLWVLTSGSYGLW